MAREKHLTSVHIGNFKRFKGLQVDNLGQFNLVVGDNNTGKTSFLEALVVDDNGAKWLGNLATVFSQREGSNYGGRLDFVRKNFSFFINDFDNSEEVNLNLVTGHESTRYHLRPFNLERDVEHLKGLERERILLMTSHQGFSVLKNDEIQVMLDEEEITQVLKKDTFVPFIPFGLGYDKFLAKDFVQYIDYQTSKRERFMEGLQLFIPELQDIRLGQDTINVFEEGQDYPNPLFIYGEGSTKLFRILCEIAMAQGKRLMIDEVDAGIHHTKFIQFWKILIQAAKAYDVQLFATTHNEECLQYFQAALELEELEAEREHARVISLKLRKENKLRAKVYDFESLQLADELGHEIRGGGL